MIPVTDGISINENEIVEEFVRASGPGGQNVNKVATAVQLRYNVAESTTLPHDVRKRLIGLAGRRMTADGVLIIQARRFRTQEQNRRDAMERLISLVRKAVEKPKSRRMTKPSPTAKQHRLDAKRRRGQVKLTRRTPKVAED